MLLHLIYFLSFIPFMILNIIIILCCRVLITSTVIFLFKLKIVIDDFFTRFQCDWNVSSLLQYFHSLLVIYSCFIFCYVVWSVSWWFQFNFNSNRGREKIVIINLVDRGIWFWLFICTFIMVNAFFISCFNAWYLHRET